MIAGATEAGVCFLEWHDRGGVDVILGRIEKRYLCTPVRSVSASAHIELLREELAQYFQMTLKEFTTPIDVFGTPFQRKVWRKLLNIPYGTTRSYGQQAANLGKSEAVRAVAAANGVNYLSILIPCHRVIGANGSLTGYGGGLWRKRSLLELEAGVIQGEVETARALTYET
ncbi:methylated-DNA--[protein]-cysteine S-methyltransferase [bacterium AH-315-J21]|nr:methylated-DNA--[protein]-cysteine S-methyltransferase [bacterium AH-315-J21]